MKVLPRLCVAAALVATVAACSDVPTPAESEIAPARRDGGHMMGGGSRASDGDTLTTTVSSTSSGPLDECTTEGRGGHMMGGGSLHEPVPCS